MSVENQTPDPRATETEALRSLSTAAAQVIDRLEGSSVHRIVLEVGRCRVEIERRPPRPTVATAGAGPPPESEDVEQTAASAPSGDSRHAIVAPLVGTFYRAPQPGAAPFVQENDIVDVGQTVCIVEAMKLMNEVRADVAGRVGEIIAQDGQWVEFEEALMFLEPTGD
jgi:acetyl-CoA carboxylase biotin carboxyl carrier protein